MKSTGIIRKVDELGRIVLPIELRRTLDIAEHDEMEIYIENDQVILRKYERSCVFCSSTQGLVQYKGKFVCNKCVYNFHRIWIIWKPAALQQAFLYDTSISEISVVY